MSKNGKWYLCIKTGYMNTGQRFCTEGEKYYAEKVQKGKFEKFNVCSDTRGSYWKKQNPTRGHHSMSPDFFYEYFTEEDLLPEDWFEI